MTGDSLTTKHDVVARHVSFFFMKCVSFINMFIFDSDKIETERYRKYPISSQSKLPYLSS